MTDTELKSLMAQLTAKHTEVQRRQITHDLDDPKSDFCQLLDAVEAEPTNAHLRACVIDPVKRANGWRRFAQAPNGYDAAVARRRAQEPSLKQSAAPKGDVYANPPNGYDAAIARRREEAR